MNGLLVLVTGTGRSGTSTISGALHHLGLSVPGPLLGANESNPRGFFESRWAVDFHKRLAESAKINPFDSRPWAFDRVQAAITPRMRGRLVQFLAEHASQPQVVIKDPRSVWTQALWKEAAAEAGLDIRYISMLRHPAEVVGSRTTYYARGDEGKLREYATFNVARWMNSSLISERETRGSPRSFVQYSELLEDWRPVLARVRSELGLTFNDDLEPGREHPVDLFIDPDLRRHRVDWGELEGPTELQRMAQDIWEQLINLSLSAADQKVSARLDDLAEEYVDLIRDASAVSHDVIEGARLAAREEGAKKARAKAAQRAAEAPTGQRVLDDVGGGELLRVLGGRVARRLRRRGGFL
jgi:hypothetical protein